MRSEELMDEWRKTKALKCAGPNPPQPTLTDEEREAIELAVHCWTQFLDVEPACEAAGETLRRLLERLK